MGGTPPDRDAFWQQELTGMGFEIELEPWDPGLQNDFEKGALNAATLNVFRRGVGGLGDPFFVFQRWTKGDTWNRSYIEDPRLDEMYKQLGTSLDPAERIRIAKEMQTIAADLVGWIPLDSARSVSPGDRTKSPTSPAGATQSTYPWTYKAAP